MVRRHSGNYGKSVGVNGKRAAVLDLRSTDPEGWENDVRPPLKNYADITVYEMHHRDFSLDSVSGIQNKGKFLALTEQVLPVLQARRQVLTI